MELLPLEQQKREGAEASADSAGEVPF
jgi:hypothetical protein